MGNVVVSMSVSVDGFVGGPNGELDWIFPHLGPEAQGSVFQDLGNTHTLLLGRVNYGLMAAVWPGQDNPMAEIMNALPKLVLSDTLGSVDWVNSRVVDREHAAEAVKLLKDETDKDLRVLGGAGIVQSLAALGLIDRYELLTIPVVLGSGLPLFVETANLTLSSATTLDSSTVKKVYLPA